MFLSYVASSMLSVHLFLCCFFYVVCSSVSTLLLLCCLFIYFYVASSMLYVHLFQMLHSCSKILKSLLVRNLRQQMRQMEKRQMRRNPVRVHLLLFLFYHLLLREIPIFTCFLAIFFLFS